MTGLAGALLAGLCARARAAEFGLERDSGGTAGRVRVRGTARKMEQPERGHLSQHVVLKFARRRKRKAKHGSRDVRLASA